MVVMPPPRTESWLMEARLEPYVHYVHYVPLHRPELVDAQLEWLRANDGRGRAIVANANRFIRTFHERSGACPRMGAADTTSVPLPCVIAPALARELITHASEEWQRMARLVEERSDAEMPGDVARWHAWHAWQRRKNAS